MVIYLDQVVLVNGLVDYLLLVVCGSVTAAPLHRGRIALTGVLGGLYAAACLLPGMRPLGTVFMQLLAGAGLCLCAFGGRNLVRRSVVLWLLGAAFCGIVLVLTEVCAAPAALLGSRVYYPVSLGALVLTAGGSYGAMRWALDRIRHHGGDLCPVTVQIGSREVSFLALRDTGNTLRDPVSGWPVMVADVSLMTRLLPEVETIRDPTVLLPKMDPRLRPRLIPFHAVGTERGMLLAVRPDLVQVDQKKRELLLAFSPVNTDQGYQALLGGDI